MNLQISPIHHIPEIRAGVNLGEYLRQGVQASGWELEARDILTVTQKVVSKAEGRIVKLSSIEPSVYSLSLGRQTGRDPRLIEVIRRESRRIVRMRGDVLICEPHHGFICANAGVDQSNVDGADTFTLLPKDPDRSAQQFADLLGCGVIVTDTFGRVWREGLVDVAIGIARVPPFVDYRGQTDTSGRALKATLLGAVDALAAAAGLVMGKTAQTPAALIRGFPWDETDSSVAALLRPPERDLFL